MGTKRTAEFRQEAVRVALTSGLDLSRFSAAPSTHLSGYSFKRQGTFPA